jgi:hypothetical protein
MGHLFWGQKIPLSNQHPSQVITDKVRHGCVEEYPMADVSTTVILPKGQQNELSSEMMGQAHWSRSRAINKPGNNQFPRSLHRAGHYMHNIHRMLIYYSSSVPQPPTNLDHM